MNRPRKTAQMNEMTPWSIEGGRGACTPRFYDPDMGDAAMAIPVAVDNFARAKTDRIFASLQADAGGVRHWTRSSPSRWRFRPPSPLTFGFRLRSSRAASTYS